MINMWLKPLNYTFSALLAVMLCILPGHAQYYYKDIVVTAQISANYHLLRVNGVQRVQATPSDATHAYSDPANPSQEGVKLEQTVYPGQNLVVTHTKTPESGESWLKAYYDGAGRLIATTDSTDEVITRSVYTYDEAGRLAAISNNSVPRNDPSEKEVHQWSYTTGGKPVKMVKIKNDHDTTYVALEADENGHPGEEKVTRSRVSIGSTFYYYDSRNRLTDVARFNKKAARILPEYMFEYNEAGQVTQMVVVPEGSSEYQTWKYVYNAGGLKVQEVCYSKQKQLLGKVEYKYEMGR